MRPIPAPRLGDTHGLLRAINQRERLRLDEFITEFSIEELFPPGLENALGRTRQFVSFARSAGLLKEDRGTVELTEIGKRYVRAGNDAAIFDVAPDQAEWLRRQLRERHMTDSIYHGAAIGLSLYASNPADFHVSRLDFGRALAYLGRAGWDNENTLESQGERYTTFLRDLELVDDDSRLTETGTQAKAELTLPIHMSLRDLAGQLNPGGPEAAEAEGTAEWAARARDGAAAEPAAEAAPPIEAPAPVPAAAVEEAAGNETGEYEEVRGSTAPIGPSPPAPSSRPVPPSDIWETAAPDEATRAYSAIKPEHAAAAAAAGAAAAPEVASGDPLADAPAAEPAESAPAAEAPEVESGDPLAAGGVSPEAEAPAPEVEAGDPLAAPDAAGAAPAGVGADAADAAPTGSGADAAPAGSGADEGERGAGETADQGSPLAAAGVTPDAGDPAASGPTVEGGDAVAGGGATADPLAAGGITPEEEVVEPEVAAGDPLAAAGGVDPEAAADAPAEAARAPEPEVITPQPEAVALEPEPAGAVPMEVDGPGVESAAPELPDAEVVDAAPAAAAPQVPDAEVMEPAPAPAAAAPQPSEAEVADAAPAAAATTSPREPSGFLDMAAVRAAAQASGLDLPDSVYANVIAALASGKHLVISGPAGSGKTTLALAVAKAAVQAGRSAGAALATASPKWSAHDTVGRVGDSGFSQGHVLAAAGRKKWLLIDEIDRAKLDKAFGDLSSFLGGLPLSLPDGSREVAAPADWRIVATRDTGRGPLEASPALLRRFAQVHLPQPERADLERAIDRAADGDATAAAAVKRLLDADLPGLGAGAYLDAARHAAERNALSPASEEELSDELMAAYIAPHLRQAEDGR